MRVAGLAVPAFWIVLGAPGAALYGSLAFLLSASTAWSAAVAALALAPMPFVGAICTASGMASDMEAF